MEARNHSPMERLTTKEFRKVLDYLHGLMELRDEQAFTQYATEATNQLLDADATALTALHPASSTAKVFLSPDNWPALPDTDERLAKGLEQEAHRFYDYWQQAGFEQPACIDELLGPRQSSQSFLYHEHYVPNQVPFGLSLFLQAQPDWQYPLSIHRSRRVFTAKERQLFALIRPHVSQAFTTAQKMSRMSQLLSSFHEALEAHHAALIFVNATGHILWITDQARTILEAFGEDASLRHDRLPDIISRWLCQDLARMDEAEQALRPHSPLKLQRGEDALTVTYRLEGTARLLLLEYQSPRRTWAALEPYGVTKQEHTVLEWVLQGKTNEEIGHILGIKTGTIQKHLSSLFIKFGVEHRTAMVTHVHDLLQRPTEGPCG
ncbi:MAG: helix-turn-helix domain-containing protein [Nitrospira sp.]|nr:helix-turn-helix domain-containing protein [Nitrospira sp.]